VKSGEVDFAQMTPTQVKDVKDLPELHPHSRAAELVAALRHEHQDRPRREDLRRQDVRIALFQLIDQEDHRRRRA